MDTLTESPLNRLGNAMRYTGIRAEGSVIMRGVSVEEVRAASVHSPV